MSAKMESLISRGPLLAPDTLSGGADLKESSALQDVEWFRQPEMIILQQGHVGTATVPPHHREDLILMKNRLLDRYRASTDKLLGYSARTLENPQDATTGKARPDITSEGKEKPFPFAAIINPVILGMLSPEAYEKMRELTEIEKSRKENGELPLVFYEEKRREHMHTLRDSIPQVHKPYLWTDAGAPVKNLGLDNKVKANFINMIFVDDTQGRIENLPFHWKQVFHWMMIAKFGSFKSVVVRYKETPDGLVMQKPTMITIEGGHADMDEDLLIDQLAVYASSLSTGSVDRKELKDEEIPLKTWEDSIAVNGLKRLGSVLGKFNLLSPAMTVEDLVSEDGMNDFQEEIKEPEQQQAEGKKRGVLGAAKKLVEDVKGKALDIVISAREYRDKVAGYSRQAEGAFYHFDPENGLYIVTATGRFGAVKTLLTNSDLSAVLPDPNDPTKVLVYPVESTEIKDPSVEAREFVGPIHETLQSSDPANEAYKVYVKRLTQEDGTFVYKLIDEGESIERDDLRVLPAVYGIAHMHRDYDEKVISSLLESGDAFEAEIPNQKVVGCGVDLMEEQSKRAMAEAVRIWNEGGRKAKMALVRVGRHGLNVFAFPTVDENGIIQPYAFSHFEAALENSSLVLTPEVRQDIYPTTIFERAQFAA